MDSEYASEDSVEEDILQELPDAREDLEPGGVAHGEAEQGQKINLQEEDSPNKTSLNMDLCQPKK